MKDYYQENHDNYTQIKIFNSLTKGVENSHKFMRYLREKITATEIQKKELTKLISLLEELIKELEEQSVIAPKINVKENGYEVIADREIVEYEKNKIIMSKFSGKD